MFYIEVNEECPINDPRKNAKNILELHVNVKIANTDLKFCIIVGTDIILKSNRSTVLQSSMILKHLSAISRSFHLQIPGSSRITLMPYEHQLAKIYGVI
jgi:hypothetical protein